MSKNKSAAANKKYESESDSFDDEPIPRKKTRATNDLNNKKNDDKHNEKRLSSDKKIANQALPRKETRSSHSERRNENSSQRDKSASQDPKNKSKIQQKIANKKGVPSKNEKSKASPDESKNKKPINAKRPRSVEKESPKEKGKGDKKQGSGKQNEKQEKNDKRGGKGHKNEKNDKPEKHDESEEEERDSRSKSDQRRKKEDEKVTVEKDEKRQTRAEKAQEAKDMKKLQTKQQTEKEKQMAEFTKKYPQYIIRGKFKFPIEDRLFDMYSAVLEEHLPEVKRPKPRPGFIPAKDLGDILQIWNFFSSFPELFKFEDIEKEEIYAGLKYNGDECLGLLNDMHQGILSLYLLEFIKKNRFETSRDETDHPFFVLIKYQTGNMTQHGDELAVIWTEFANQLAGIPPFGDHYTETLKRYFKNLATKTCLHYNKLEYKQKIKILLNLIEGIYETDVFKDFLQSKMDATSALIKERNDLNNEIKQDEQEFIALKAKLAQAQKGVKKADSFRGNSSTRLETLRRPRNAAEIGKQDVIQRLTDEVNVLEELINKKQETVDAINSELVLTLQTATFLGVDGDKTEYWVFQAEPDRVYIRNPSIMSTDEEWYYYNTKADILALVDSLNTKGIKESQLQEQLLDLIEDGTIIFDEDELEEEQEEEVKTPKRRGRPKKNTEEELAKEEEEAKIEAKPGNKRMEVEDEEDDDDGYVVRKKENGAASKNKESSPKETPIAVEEQKTGQDEMNIEKPETATENVEEKVEEKKEAGGVEEEVQKVEEEPVEEEKVNEEKKEEIEKAKAKKAHDEREIARQKELEIEREKQQERIRERQRAHEERLQRLQRKLQEANSELNFDYWFAKVLEYQAPEAVEEITSNAEPAVANTTIATENPNEPQSADKREEQQQQIEAQPEAVTQKLTAKKKSPQDLNLDFIKRMLLETEEYLTTYLVKWEARWAHPDIRKELIQNLKDAETIEDLRPVLLKLNEFFQYSETPRGRRGRPVRNKSNEENGGKEGEGDNMEEEDEEDEEYKDDWGSKNGDEEGAEGDEEEKANHETENQGDSEIRTEKEEADKEQKSSATKTEKPPGTKTEQVKKMPLKFWGAFTTRLKKSWATYTAEADNLGAIYFATSLLCETVNVYVEKKNARYFTEYKTGKEYLAAKKRQKEEAYEQRAEAEQAAIEAVTESRNAPVQAPRDYLDRSSRQTRAARGPVTRGYRYNDNRYVVDDDSQEKSSTESDSMVSRLRKRTRRPPKFPDEIYTQKPNRAQEALRLRQQQERLEELAGLRRSTRITNQFRKKYTSLDEQQWYKECKVCLKSDGEFIACSNCSEYYHPACVGLDNTQPLPDEGWTCGPCVEHIANSRQTRSSSRRIQL